MTRLTPEERAEALARARAERKRRAAARAGQPPGLPPVAAATPMLVKCAWCTTMNAAGLDRCTHCGAPRTST
jgi:hypothetical protein